MGMSVRELFFSSNEKELFKQNREAVNEFLISVTRVAAVILGILMAFLAFISFRFGYTDSYKRVYLLFFALDAFIFSLSFVFKGFYKKHPVILVYIFFFLYICFAISANFSYETDQEYVSAVVVVFMIPLLLLDRSWRVNLLVCLAVAASAFFSVKFKDRHFVASDLVNLSLYAFAGIVMGKSVRMNRLHGFDAQRVLTVERNTDSLTKLPNRRKLFEHLRNGINSLLMRPTGMFMMDIDHFKQFNDHYGHRSGDICLGEIGHCFAEFGEKHKIKIFRYGGEEFCALCWSKDYKELGEAAEELLEAVRALQIKFDVPENPLGIVTISLGYAGFDQNNMNYDFENMIKVTDGALYKAKSDGRNCARGAR